MSHEAGTMLEQCGNEVALDLMPHMAGVDEDLRGIDFKTILDIVMTVIQTLMENCPQSSDKLAKSFKAPGPLQRVALLKACKDHCDCCGNPSTHKLAGAMQRSMLARAAMMSEDQALQLINEAKGFDYLLA